MCELVHAELGLGNEGNGAGLGGRLSELLGLVSGHDENLCRPMFRGDAPGCFQSVDPGQIDVHQHQIGPQLGGKLRERLKNRGWY